jgi:succinoglycan biosynthesis protein ExoA
MTSISPAVRRISVVVPMRNEAHRVERLVADIRGQDFAGELEVLVADGRSSDGSVERLRSAAGREGLPVTVLDNPEQAVAPALNLLIPRASGDLIVRLDCKSRYPPDYLRRCALAAEETGAWNVGGRTEPEGRTRTERAVACAMDSPFGGIHSRFVRGRERVDTDTVYCGAFRPEAFRRVGLFALLGPDHDEELNFRIRAAGGRVVFDPAIHSYYTGRGSFRDIVRQYHDYGFWKLPVVRRHGRRVGPRPLVPATFVASLALLGAAAPASRRARRLLAVEVCVYSGCAVGFGAATIRRRRESWRLLPRVVAVFAAFHVSYGVGILRGGFRRSAEPATAARDELMPRAPEGRRQLEHAQTLQRDPG